MNGRPTQRNVPGRLRWIAGLALLLVSASAHAESTPAVGAAADGVVEAFVEESEPLRDELGFLRVPRVELATEFATTERPGSYGAALRIAVPTTLWLVLGVETRLSQYRLSVRSQRIEVSLFSRLRYSARSVSMFVVGEVGYARARDPSLHGRSGIVGGLHTGLELGRTVRVVVTVGWRRHNFGNGEHRERDPNQYNELVFGLGLEFPIWKSR